MTDMSMDIASSRTVMVIGAGALMRVVGALCGLALVVSAFGIWLVPADLHYPELLLIKLGVSLFMLIVGLCCLSCARPVRKMPRRY